MRSYSERDDRRQADTQRDLVRVLDAAAEAAAINRGQWLSQAAGDGELSLVPLDGSEPRVIYHFVYELDHELARYNQDRVATARMRLRVAIHQGVAYPAANGFAGDAVVVVSRLLDSAPVRGALVAAPGANLALIVSHNVYEDVVRGGHTRYRDDDFRRVAVEVKDFTADAWVWVPRYDVHRLPIDDPTSQDASTTQHAAVGTNGAVNQAGRDIRVAGASARPAAEYHFDGPIHAPGGMFGPNFGTVELGGHD